MREPWHRKRAGARQNRAAASAISLRRCRDAAITGCMIENYSTIGIEDRKASPHYGYAFKVFGTHGSGTLRPIEPPSLEIERVTAAGPYMAGLHAVPMPKYERWVAELPDLAAGIRGERQLAVTLEDELLVQKWLLEACDMT